MTHYNCRYVVLTVRPKKVGRGPMRPILRSLARKKVLAISPDGKQFKFTDRGIDAFKTMKLAQDQWNKQSVVRVGRSHRSQLLIKAGQLCKANQQLRKMLGAARRQLLILDPYIGSCIFDILDETRSSPKIKIIHVRQDKACSNRCIQSVSVTTLKNRNEDSLWNDSRSFCSCRRRCGIPCGAHP